MLPSCLWEKGGCAHVDEGGQDKRYPVTTKPLRASTSEPNQGRRSRSRSLVSGGRRRSHFASGPKVQHSHPQGRAASRRASACNASRADRFASLNYITRGLEKELYLDTVPRDGCEVE